TTSTSHYTDITYIPSSLRYSRPPTSPPFPYTTLFRSDALPQGERRAGHGGGAIPLRHGRSSLHGGASERRHRSPRSLHRGHDRRSEEHTSELQSRENLVCRLLLEKKKTTTTSKQARDT